MTFNRLGAALALTVLTSTAVAAQRSVTLLQYKATVPTGWVTSPSTSSMRVAQYTIPGARGAVADSVVVYFFGQGQGGNVAANLARWKGQFTPSAGKPVYENVTHDATGAFPITVAEYRGTYARMAGPGDAGTPKPGQSLIAAIAETPKGSLFFQLFGATENVTPQREALIKFVKSLK